jgi:hypothetical protein
LPTSINIPQAGVDEFGIFEEACRTIECSLDEYRFVWLNVARFASTAWRDQF